MFRHATGFKEIFICTGYTDLRKGIQGLATIIEKEFKRNPYEKNVLYLFCGRRTDRLKALLFEGDGFLLIYKRLESGQFVWPRSANEARRINSQQYKWLMQGYTIEKRSKIPDVKPARIA